MPGGGYAGATHENADTAAQDAYAAMTPQAQQAASEKYWRERAAADANYLRERAAKCTRLGGQPKIGMTVEQVAATCWGRPGKINRTQTGAGTYDQYVYAPTWAYGQDRYLYFQNGILTSMQTSD